MAKKSYDEPVVMSPESAPPGSYLLGKTQIHRVDAYEGSQQWKASSWDTLNPEEIDPDSPAITGRLLPVVSKPQQLIDPKRIGAKLKIERKAEALEEIGSLLREASDALTDEPATVSNLIGRCPSFAGLEHEAATHRTEALLGLLVKDGVAVKTEDGSYVRAATADDETPTVDEDEEPELPPEGDDDNEEPVEQDDDALADADEVVSEPEPEPAPPIDKPTGLPKPKARRPARSEQPLPQAAAASAMEPVACLLNLPIDVEAACQALNPTWLSKNIDETAVDEGVKAMIFLTGHLLAGDSITPLMRDTLIDLARELRDTLRLLATE